MALLGFGAVAGVGVCARRPDGVVVDLSRLGPAFEAEDLHPLLHAGPRAWAVARDAVDAAPELGDEAALAARALVPVHPGDYVDFYACEHHAANLGRRFRPGQPPLPPAWRHLPIGYHGRTSTIVASGSPVLRPAGHVVEGEGPPTFGPTRRLDVEVELGFVVGVGTERGRPVRAADAWDHLFGVVLLDDWSARDVQAFEYVPLGPHLGKSFCTSISTWVVPLDLVPRAPLAGTGVELAPHLRDDDHAAGAALDVDLVLAVDDVVVSRTSARHLAWSPAQLLAHLTSNGAAVRPGDLLGSGTISGPEPGTEGSLIELGLPFLSDGQTATITSDLLGRVEGRVAPCPTT